MTAVELSQVAAGDRLPDLELHLTRPDVVRYSGASTDFNPIHYSDRIAKAIGLPGVVVHGMWTMGAALRIVTDWWAIRLGSPATSSGSSTRCRCPTTMRAPRCRCRPTSPA